MSLARCLAGLTHLSRILGAPGLIMASVSLMSLAFGLVLLFQEYNRLQRLRGEGIRGLIVEWVRTQPVDDVGRTLRDHTASWASAPLPSLRESRGKTLRSALENLGESADPPSRSLLDLLRISSLELRQIGEPTLALWRPEVVATDETAPGIDVPPIHEVEVPIAESAATRGSAISLRVRYQLSEHVERVLGELERSYRRLLLAIAGLAGYSLLCLSYMVLQARSLVEHAARDAAQRATLDLADRTCHELGNVTFALANERRNLADHLALVDRFLTEWPEAWTSIAARSNLDSTQSARLLAEIQRELADRGLDPQLELAMSTSLARGVCRQIEVCSSYVALTIRELDSFLRRIDLPLNLELVSVPDCIDDAIAILGPRLESSRALIRRLDRDQPLPIRADRRLLVHALVNLLKNAVEASLSADREPTIEVHARAAENSIIIEIRDHGPGMEPDRLAHIFDRGFSTKGTNRGHGLVIALESIEAQGGSLTAESSPGRGSTFRLTLPAAT